MIGVAVTFYGDRDVKGYTEFPETHEGKRNALKFARIFIPGAAELVTRESDTEPWEPMSFELVQKIAEMPDVVRPGVNVTGHEPIMGVPMLDGLTVR